MDTPTIELATTDQLIKELMHRTAFRGVLVASEVEFAGNVTGKVPIVVHESIGLDKRGTCLMLSEALTALLKEAQPGRPRI